MKPWLILAAALATAMVAPAHALSNFGNIGKALQIGKKAVEASRDFTPQEEVEIGKGMAANLLGAAPLVRDEELQRYVNRVGRWLARHTEKPDLEWRFAVIDNPGYNAFALPGGTILITLGLYRSLRDESELAGVLAHEMAHVLQQHQIKAIKKAAGKELATMLASEATARSGSRDAHYLNRAFGVGTEILVRGLDKEDEYQADQMGVVIATRAGYNPYGLVGVLQTIDAANPKDGAMALLFATHPSAGSRIERLNQRLGVQFDDYADRSHTPQRMVAVR